MIELLYLTHRWDPNVYYYLISVNLDIAMNRYSIFPKAPGRIIYIYIYIYCVCVCVCVYVFLTSLY